jgi:hypothetical protein
MLHRFQSTCASAPVIARFWISDSFAKQGCSKLLYAVVRTLTQLSFPLMLTNFVLIDLLSQRDAVLEFLRGVDIQTRIEWLKVWCRIETISHCPGFRTTYVFESRFGFSLFANHRIEAVPSTDLRTTCTPVNASSLWWKFSVISSMISGDASTVKVPELSSNLTESGRSFSASA